MSDRLEKCVVCDQTDPALEWNDLHGEASCVQCGTPYMIFRYGEDGKRLEGPPVPRFNERLMAVLREYWAETRQHNGLGTFMGWCRDPDRLEAHMEWASKRHPELLEAKEGEEAEAR